jgi:hypothetical protein
MRSHLDGDGRDDVARPDLIVTLESVSGDLGIGRAARAPMV